VLEKFLKIINVRGSNPRIVSVYCFQIEMNNDFEHTAIQRCFNCDTEDCPYAGIGNGTCDDWSRTVLEIEVPEEICNAVSFYLGGKVLEEAERILNGTQD